MITKALIAVRSGSLRVANKNTKSFSNSSLLEIKIKQLLSVSNLDGVVVNSNDHRILDIAAKFDVELIERDQYFASNEVSMSEVYKNMAENINTDIVVYANVTNPLIEVKTIRETINFYQSGGDFDSVNTSHAIKEFMFLNGKPINYDLKNQPRSQDLPNIQSLNFAISVIDRKLMIEKSNIVGDLPFLLEIGELESLDIDTPLDYELAEILYNKYIYGH
jgi:CMP-N,N'-diacetyllegionaminic acid synthase